MPDVEYAAADNATRAPKKSSLDLKFYSHATIDVADIDRARKFYEEFMGFDVVQTSKISLLIRMGGQTTIAVVKVKNPLKMDLMNHNGLDVRTKEEVDHAHEVVVAEAETWGLHKITTPSLQHGTYSFYFWDADENVWEILTNPDGGYDWLYGVGNQSGKGHHDRNFKRPGVNI